MTPVVIYDDTAHKRAFGRGPEMQDAEDPPQAASVVAVGPGVSEGADPAAADESEYGVMPASSYWDS